MAATTSRGRGSALLADVRTQTLEHLRGTPIHIVCKDGAVETVQVGKLSINQLVAVGRFAYTWMRTLNAEDLAAVREDMEAGNVTDAVATKVDSLIDRLMPLVDADQIGDLVGIVIDQDSAWCQRNVGLADIAAITEAVLEHNDWSTIAASFGRAARRLRTTSSSPA